MHLLAKVHEWDLVMIDFTEYIYKNAHYKMSRRSRKMEENYRTHSKLLNEAYVLNAMNYILNDYRHLIQSDNDQEVIE